MVKAAAVGQKAGDGQSDDEAGVREMRSSAERQGEAMTSAATPTWMVASWPVGT